MIDHLSITVSDIEKGRTFYDAALAPLGVKRAMDFDVAGVGHGTGYGTSEKPVFWIGEGTPALAGHIAFRASSRALVDAFYQAAMTAGAKDNGAPGLRPHYHANYYAAFVIDPDGNRLEAVCHLPG